MPINICELAGYTPYIFEYEPQNIFGRMDFIRRGKPEKNLNNPIVNVESESPEPWVEYYRQSTIKGKSLTINDNVFKDHWKHYHLVADKWDCICKEEDKTEWC